MADDTTHPVPAVPDDVISEAHGAFLHAFSSTGSRNAVAAALRTATPMLYRAWLHGSAAVGVDVGVDVEAHHLAELRGVQDRYMRLLTTERDRRDREQAATRRAALDWATFQADMWAAARLREIEAPVRSVLYRISQLSDRPAKTPIAELRHAAVLAGHQLDYAATRDEPDDVRRINGMREEIMRLRRHIEASGRAIHRAEHGTDSCSGRCRGCRLIVGMDVGQPVERRGSTESTDTSPQRSVGDSTHR